MMKKMINKLALVIIAMVVVTMSVMITKSEIKASENYEIAEFAVAHDIGYDMDDEVTIEVIGSGYDDAMKSETINYRVSINGTTRNVTINRNYYKYLMMRNRKNS